MTLDHDKKLPFREWVRRGDPFIWFNAAAVSISIVAVVGLLFLLVVRGFGHFWPADVMQAQYQLPGSTKEIIIGELVESTQVSLEQIESSGIKLDTSDPFVERSLYKMGNRDITGADFRWILNRYLTDITYPEDIIVLERREWGNFYGYLVAVKASGEKIADASVDAEQTWQAFEKAFDRAAELHVEVKYVEKSEIGSVNNELERLRLEDRGLELDEDLNPADRAAGKAEIQIRRDALNAEYEVLQTKLFKLYEDENRDSFVVRSMDGTEIEIDFGKLVHAYKPNAMNTLDKVGFYFAKLGEFLTDEPREANTEGGIFPAIFGTVMMVIIMSIIVTPFGVIAAVYLREYAKQGVLTRTVRIAVNNLAGVPSIVYGVFGLGFFIYFVGAEIDNLLFEAALPAPTFGTPGLMWASLTLALLTLPVVIVATEEGLSRIPRAVREGSLALGATKAETLWRVVLPMASPAMMTGLILAVARAAGEVAPLMLVGVVKLAPSLPVDGNYPYLHLDQKFMHLGFHIYDVGFQSPNVEAARPLVYATALLLVIIIALLNFTAVALRNHLREKYKSLEM